MEMFPDVPGHLEAITDWIPYGGGTRVRYYGTPIKEIEVLHEVFPGGELWSVAFRSPGSVFGQCVPHGSNPPSVECIEGYAEWL